MSATDNFLEKEFNLMMVETFHLILKEEMEFIKSLAEFDLSSREIHFLQTVGIGNGNYTITDIASALHITLASITVIAARLELGGFITKTRADDDGRKVMLCLTQKGKAVDSTHNAWHENLVKKITAGMSQFEKEILLFAIKRLNDIVRADLYDLSQKK